MRISKTLLIFSASLTTRGKKSNGKKYPSVETLNSDKVKKNTSYNVESTKKGLVTIDTSECNNKYIKNIYTIIALSFCSLRDCAIYIIEKNNNKNIIRYSISAAGVFAMLLVIIPKNITTLVNAKKFV